MWNYEYMQRCVCVSEAIENYDSDFWVVLQVLYNLLDQKD